MQVKAAHSHLEKILEQYRPDLSEYEDIYKDFHQHPELGKTESRTASVVAKHLRALSLEVYEKIGGHGLVGILENGDGPVVMLRADMDALPLKEETGLSYASKATQKNTEGIETPVMHACGHDFHVTWLMAISTFMCRSKAKWAGTVIFLFQPNEEGSAGAQAMVDDGLYDKVPRPHVLLSQHVDYKRTGWVAIRSGPFMNFGDSFAVRIHGRGGHGSQPQNCIDPIVIASYIIVRLQSIISRVIAPAESACITCGSIHGGDAENIIPDYVDIKLNIRSLEDGVRGRILAAMHSIVKSEAASAGADKEPDIRQTSKFPRTSNDPGVVARLSGTWKSFFKENVVEQERLAGSDDLSNLARPFDIPYAYWFIGGTEAEKWDEAEENDAVARLPHNHSPLFAPVIEPTLKTGFDAMALGALTFLTILGDHDENLE